MPVERFDRFTCDRCGMVEEKRAGADGWPDGWKPMDLGKIHAVLCPRCSQVITAMLPSVNVDRSIRDIDEMAGL